MNLKILRLMSLMTIKIISPGLQTTVQDMGRIGWRHMGVPESGAADKFSMKLANQLLKKNLNSPVLECTLTGPMLKFLKPLTFVITGANMESRINNNFIENNVPYKVKENDVLSLSNCSTGCRSYIAFSEDIICNSFLESYSTYLPAQLGGINGLALQAGFTLKTQPCELTLSREENIDINQVHSYQNEWKIRVLVGPEFNLLADESKETVFKSNYLVTNDTSRMGTRIKGINLQLDNKYHMLSAPVNTGTIQCPENGLPIILGCDAQTLGGYPRILQIAEIDHPIIGQLRPNDKISFINITIEEASKQLVF
tara:strand:- start:5004 stop:5939 length:936 start_codon:yes stop_codon:yes gene_type:complete